MANPRKRGPLFQPLAVFLALVFVASGCAPAWAGEKLPTRYRKWLDEEIVYIINEGARETFLRQGATSSLESDVLLSTIRNLANYPLAKADLQHRRQLLESVTARLIPDGQGLDDCQPSLESGRLLHWVSSHEQFAP